MCQASLDETQKGRTGGRGSIRYSGGFMPPLGFMPPFGGPAPRGHGAGPPLQHQNGQLPRRVAMDNMSHPKGKRESLKNKKKRINSGMYMKTKDRRRKRDAKPGMSMRTQAVTVIC
jgi:hypothetical protein